MGKKDDYPQTKSSQVPSKKGRTALEIIGMAPGDKPIVGTQRWADAKEAREAKEKKEEKG